MVVTVCSCGVCARCRTRERVRYLRSRRRNFAPPRELLCECGVCERCRSREYQRRLRNDPATLEAAQQRAREKKLFEQENAAALKQLLLDTEQNRRRALTPAQREEVAEMVCLILGVLDDSVLELFESPDER
jgi:hypothetical protein